MNPPTPPESNPWLQQILHDLVARKELLSEQVDQVLQYMMSGQCSQAECAAFLVALRMKGETASEVAAAAKVLRQHMLRWDPGREGVLDTCGTGGDGSNTFNISTATAIVAAGGGVPVVKHGNRAASSKSGSADVLSQLGVSIEGDAESARKCLAETNLAFCFAPRFHPSMRHVAPVRKKLGIPTLFNCLGPLANPAGAPYQLLGVGKKELLDLMAGALAQLDTKKTLLVHGEDGLDEVTLAAPTQVRMVQGKIISSFVWKAQDFGLPSCSLSDLQAVDSAASAAIIKQVLSVKEGPAMNIVLANTAAAFIAAEQVETPSEGVEKARAALDSGQALEVLEKLVQFSRNPNRDQ